MDTCTADAWRLTRRLLDDANAAVDAGADSAVQAMAHLGVAILLFAECDPATVEAVASALKKRAYSNPWCLPHN